MFDHEWTKAAHSGGHGKRGATVQGVGPLVCSCLTTLCSQKILLISNDILEVARVFWSFGGSSAF